MSKENTRVDVEKAFLLSGTDVYATIIQAAASARKIKSERDKLDSERSVLHKYTHKPINQALQDIIDRHTK